MVAALKQQDESVTDLFRALVNEGFTVCCCGPEGDPTALVAWYQWDEHVDVVTVPQGGGPAAAARLARPADPLDPPPTAVWTWEGDPESAIWALLRLAHPDHPDAPDMAARTPAPLRVPPELQLPTTVRDPAPGIAEARADRLRQERDNKDISREFFRELFDQVDSAAAIAAAQNFTYDGTFVFANFPPMSGPMAITRFTTTLFDLVAGVKHWMHNFWELPGQMALTNGLVTFTKHDGTELTAPFATVSQFNDDRTLLIYHQVYVDASALMPAPPL